MTKAKKTEADTNASADTPPADLDRQRPKNTRDPAVPAGAINVPGLDTSTERNPAAVSGSRFFSSSIDNKWVIVNARFEVVRKGPFENEQAAADEAARLNALPEAPTLDIE